MKVGIGDLKTVPPQTFVTNISGINTFLLCQERWMNSAIHKRVPAVIEHDYLKNGTVGHAAIQDLHEVMGDWAPDAALGIAHKHAATLMDEVDGPRGNQMTDKDRESRIWFARWLVEVLPLYAEKFRRSPWEKVLHVEQPVWVILELDELPAAPAQALRLSGYSRLCIIGTPDAIAIIRGKVWHIQRKFFNERFDLRAFIDMGPAQKHEVAYLQIFDFLHEDGQLPHPAGHTLFDLLRKLEPARHPSTYSPPKVCGCYHDNEDAHYMAFMAAHPVLAKRSDARQRWRDHREEDVQKLDNFKRNQQTRQHTYDTWLDRAFVREESIVKRAQRARIWDQILLTSGEMALVGSEERPPLMAQGPACDAYFRACPYKKVCAGRCTINGPQFVAAKPSYLDIPVEGEE